jgi:uncharacterized protein (TIGR02266 family)
MSYSGAQTAKTSRENLGRALAALQEDPNIPPDVLAIAQNIAQAMAALFEAERAGGEPEGKAAVKRGLGVVGQTLALLQDVRGQHRGIQIATESIAQTMSALYPLTTKASMVPPAMQSPAIQQPQPVPQGMGGAPMMGQPAPGYGQQPQAAYAATQVAAPKPAQQAWQPPPQQQYQPPQQQYQPPPQQQYQPPPQAQFQPPQQPAANPYNSPIIPTTSPANPPYQPPTPQAGAYREGNKERVAVEVNIGATTDSNFYVGFSGEISEGGVFCATYNIQPRGTAMRVLVTLPGNFEKHVNGFVRFVRDPMDLTAESEPGMGIQFEGLDPEARELILRFIRKRAPMFYDE